MEQILIVLLNSLSSAINAYADLVAEHPWVMFATAVAPGVPALLALAIPSAILCAFIGLAGSLAVISSAKVGIGMWAGAWLLSFVLARSKARQRRARLSPQGTVPEASV